MESTGNTVCPVCTLYLRPGITLQSHLETHPKDKVIEALVRQQYVLPAVFNAQQVLCQPYVYQQQQQQQVIMAATTSTSSQQQQHQQQQAQIIPVIVSSSTVSSFLAASSSIAAIQQNNQSEISNSQILAPSNSQMLGPSNPQIMNPSNSQMLAPSNSQILNSSNSQMLAPSNSQMLSPSNPQILGPSNSQMLGPSNTQILSPSNSQILDPSNTQMLSPSNSSMLSPSEFSNQTLIPSNSGPSNSLMFGPSNSSMLGPSNSSLPPSNSTSNSILNQPTLISSNSTNSPMLGPSSLISSNSTLLNQPTLISSNSTMLNQPTLISSNSAMMGPSNSLMLVSSNHSNSSLGPSNSSMLGAISSNSTMMSQPSLISSNATILSQPTLISSNSAMLNQPTLISSNSAMLNQPTLISSNSAMLNQPTLISSNSAMLNQPTLISSNATTLNQPNLISSNSMIGPSNSLIVGPSNSSIMAPSISVGPNFLNRSNLNSKPLHEATILAQQPPQFLHSSYEEYSLHHQQQPSNTYITSTPSGAVYIYRSNEDEVVEEGYGEESEELNKSCQTSGNDDVEEIVLVKDEECSRRKRCGDEAMSEEEGQECLKKYEEEEGRYSKVECEDRRNRSFEDEEIEEAELHSKVECEESRVLKQCEDDEQLYLKECEDEEMEDLNRCEDEEQNGGCSKRRLLRKREEEDARCSKKCEDEDPRCLEKCDDDEDYLKECEDEGMEVSKVECEETKILCEQMVSFKGEKERDAFASSSRRIRVEIWEERRSRRTMLRNLKSKEERGHGSNLKKIYQERRGEGEDSRRNRLSGDEDVNVMQRKRRGTNIARHEDEEIDLTQERNTEVIDLSEETNDRVDLEEEGEESAARLVTRRKSVRRSSKRNQQLFEVEEIEDASKRRTQQRLEESDNEDLAVSRSNQKHAASRRHRQLENEGFSSPRSNQQRLENQDFAASRSNQQFRSVAIEDPIYSSSRKDQDANIRLTPRRRRSSEDQDANTRLTPRRRYRRRRRFQDEESDDDEEEEELNEDLSTSRVLRSGKSTAASTPRRRNQGIEDQHLLQNEEIVEQATSSTRNYQHQLLQNVQEHLIFTSGNQEDNEVIDERGNERFASEANGGLSEAVEDRLMCKRESQRFVSEVEAMERRGLLHENQIEGRFRSDLLHQDHSAIERSGLLHEDQIGNGLERSDEVIEDRLICKMESQRFAIEAESSDLINEDQSRDRLNAMDYNEVIDDGLSRRRFVSEPTTTDRSDPLNENLVEARFRSDLLHETRIEATEGSGLLQEAQESSNLQIAYLQSDEIIEYGPGRAIVVKRLDEATVKDEPSYLTLTSARQSPTQLAQPRRRSDPRALDMDGMNLMVNSECFTLNEYAIGGEESVSVDGATIRADENMPARGELSGQESSNASDLVVALRSGCDLLARESWDEEEEEDDYEGFQNNFSIGEDPNLSYGCFNRFKQDAEAGASEAAQPMGVFKMEKTTNFASAASTSANAQPVEIFNTASPASRCLKAEKTSSFASSSSGNQPVEIFNKRVGIFEAGKASTSLNEQPVEYFNADSSVGLFKAEKALAASSSLNNQPVEVYSIATGMSNARVGVFKAEKASSFASAASSLNVKPVEDFSTASSLNVKPVFKTEKTTAKISVSVDKVEDGVFYAGNPIVCTICSCVLDCVASLKQHSEEVHGLKGDEKYKCAVCGEAFQTEPKFTQHLQVHPLECRLCGKYFYRRQNLQLHLKRHMNIRPYKCTSCDKSFLTKQKLDEHRNVHTGAAPIKCPLCDETFRRHSNLVQHRNRHHFDVKRKVKDFVCACGEVFHTKKKLAWHRETHDGKPKACAMCSEKFVHVASLTRHMRKAHNEKFVPDAGRDKENVECPVCKNVYLRSSLEVHMKTHTGARPFACSICNKDFTTKWNLKLHKWTHAARVNKPYKCDRCKGAFVRASDYAAHMNAHRSVRPYTCNHCGAQFIRKYNCLRHVREHERTKTHACQICGKEFHRSYYLKDHMRVHSGARPYACHICGKTSATKSNHNKHVRIHHARDPVSTEN